jgi:hypothetical protein
MSFLLFPVDELESLIELRTPIEELSWVRGRPLDETIPELLFEVDAGQSFRWPDFAGPAVDIPLVSPKMRQALERSGADNIEYHPARLINRTTGEGRPYFGANIIGLVRAMDKDKSNFLPYEKNPDIAVTINRLAVDDSKFDGLKILRLAEFDLLIIVDDSLKEALERQALIGLDFVPPEDWDGFRT